MIELLKAALFGIVEGITEWLPVSSTGHMILLDEFVSLRVSPLFLQMFMVVIQLGAILAVIIMYWNTIWPIRKDRKTGKYRIDQDIISLWGKVIAACLPAAVVGILADDWLDVHFRNWVVVSIMLILVGAAFIVIENRNRGRKPVTRRLHDISLREAMIIGLFQLIAAIFPGTSRSGATILGGIMIGVSRPAAAFPPAAENGALCGGGGPLLHFRSGEAFRPAPHFHRRAGSAAAPAALCPLPPELYGAAGRRRAHELYCGGAARRRESAAGQKVREGPSDKPGGLAGRRTTINVDLSHDL